MYATFSRDNLMGQQTESAFNAIFGG
eukprot:SAG22_NODE_19716_length_272_cov_0.710983_1_plen_25_part_01